MGETHGTRPLHHFGDHGMEQGHFGDVLPSQSLGSVLKRNQNPTKLTTQNQSNLN